MQASESKEVDKIAEVTEQLADTEGIETAQGVRQAAEARIRALDAQAKPLYDALEAVSVKEAAGAREHADRGKALQQRAGKLVTEKADHLRKGASASEAAKRIAPAVRALQDARAEWAAAGEALLG
ncbi:hypothetical protein MNEG_6360 [Monoraphidium neglectum]|uniref:Uncharacterized protein n=1 Tax=Monoraphidium neglectum TaxID=145388 RepID=A0A0D2JRA2_9CHLO|nr:hypothetical protein MNEG_6360 [Monoraphidium neglectum]KIZ01598.1 hypothetical protein MNEG_6360 [Monoraphidium neglectum]|eukprot:XP_013900617.1 hypothetical protein MNEG_6360 [Monoraphidium neglectum]